MNTTTDMQGPSPIEITIMFVRAMGPVTIDEIEYELKTQCPFTKTPEDAKRQAKKVVQHGLDRGWLVQYDEESYSIHA